MKKLLIVIPFLAVFIGYVAWRHLEEPEDVPAVIPPIPSDTTSSGAGNTDSTTPNIPVSVPSRVVSTYRDGQYIGPVSDAYYGYIQVQATIKSDKITAVKFLKYPNDRDTSRMINSQAMPYLIQEAIASQTSQVDIVSGATDSSLAFRQSLAGALNQAKN